MTVERWSGSGRVRALFWLALGFSFVMALMPHPPRLPGEPDDKIQHIAAFVTLALLGSWAFPRAKGWPLLAWLSAYGALIEIAQAIPMLHRDSDALDWVADTAAAGTILLVVRWWRSRSA
jgi:hypothetical protein